MAALVCAVLLGGCSLKTEKLEELIPFGSKGSHQGGDLYRIRS